VTCEATPHHFTLTDESVADYRTFAKMAPPLRSEENRLAVLEGLKDGTIDAIATDHAPHDQESKRVPFAHAANGVVGLETLLPLALDLYHLGHMPLLGLLKTVTVTPADLLGIPAGRLQRGRAADLVLFAPALEWTLETQALRSKSKNSPFADRRMKGRALRTIVNGQMVYELGRPRAR
jgi:dihydroorotase